MRFLPCKRCCRTMTGIVSYETRTHCDNCGCQALQPHGDDVTKAEREEIFAYHAQIRDRYTKATRRP